MRSKGTETAERGFGSPVSKYSEEDMQGLDTGRQINFAWDDSRLIQYGDGGGS